MPDLTSKQARFVEQYLIDLNATQAAIRAGYSAKTAETAGPRLLGNVRVAQAIEEGKRARSLRSQVTQDRVIEELARIAFADMRDYFVWGPGKDGESRVIVRPSTELTDDQAAAVAEVSQTVTAAGGTLRVKLHDKMAALNLLAKHVGGFTDKVEHSGEIAFVIHPDEVEG